MDHQQEHLTDAQAEQFRRRRMSAQEKAGWERHMVGCHGCLELVYGKASSFAVQDRLVNALTVSGETEFHLAMPELQRYVNGSMDEADRTIFESHLEDCPACRSQAEALAAEPSRPPSMPQPAQPRSFWHGLVRFWQEPRFAWPARVAVASVLGVVLLIGWAAWRNRNANIVHPGQDRGSDAAIVARLQDGSTEIILDKEGSLTGIVGLDPAVTDSVREALTTAGLSKPQVLSELAGPPIKFMGQSGSAPPFALMSPVNTVVEEQQPTLQWQALSGATSYTVAVFDSGFQPVTRARLGAATEWRVPTPLRRGATYFWQVTARKGKLEITVPSAPAPRAAFKVLDSQTASGLEKARIATKSHLVLGILYAREGLRLEAERELQALAQENPQSPLAAKLVSDVKSWGR
jgi:hypothetical protein